MKTRRTKKEMEQMESDVRYYLSYNSLDAHQAYNSYIKDYLISGHSLPYYINGIKDFLKFETIMKTEQKQREEQNRIKQEEQKQKKNIIKQIQSLPVSAFITAYRQAKESGTNEHKMALCDMATLQNAGDLQEKYITYYYIDVCRQYKLI